MAHTSCLELNIEHINIWVQVLLLTSTSFSSNNSNNSNSTLTINIDLNKDKDQFHNLHKTAITIKAALQCQVILDSLM